jgi:hypothetical protein
VAAKMGVAEPVDAVNLSCIAHLYAANVKVKLVQTLKIFTMKMIERLKNSPIYYI